MRCHRSFVIVFNGKATPRHLHTAEADGKPIAVRWFACIADGHYDPAPIGIFARDGSLHQWRIGDGKRYLSIAYISDSQIGRASFRDRVCQYVYIVADADSLKKTKKTTIKKSS